MRNPTDHRHLMFHSQAGPSQHLPHAPAPHRAPACSSQAPWPPCFLPAACCFLTPLTSFSLQPLLKQASQDWGRALHPRMLPSCGQAAPLLGPQRLISMRPCQGTAQPSTRARAMASAEVPGHQHQQQQQQQQLLQHLLALQGLRVAPQLCPGPCLTPPRPLLQPPAPHKPLDRLMQCKHRHYGAHRRLQQGRARGGWKGSSRLQRGPRPSGRPWQNGWQKPWACAWWQKPPAPAAAPLLTHHPRGPLDPPAAPPAPPQPSS